MVHTHILVVDDEPEIADSVADYLIRKMGYTVTQAGDGRRAMEILTSAPQSSKGPVDLVVMDMRMPGMTGREVLTWLRKHPTLSYTRVIMLTAASGSEDKVDALSAGADDYIVKPYQPQELLARVQTILRTQQLEKQLQRQSTQLATLNRASNAITTTLDFRQIPMAAVASVRALLGVELSALLLHDREKQLLLCQALNSESSDADISQHANNPENSVFAPVPSGLGIIGRAFETKSLIVLNDPQADARFHPDSDSPTGYQVNNLLVLPLVVRGNAIGVLVALNKTPEPFTEVDSELFASLGGAVSRAIENANLFRRIRVRQQELQESHNRLQAVIDGIRNPIYTINRSWRLVSVNEAEASKLNVSPDKLVGRHCYSALFDRQSVCEACQVAQTLADQQAYHWSVSWLGEDRLPEEWEVHAYPIPGSSINAAKAVIVWQDRTEERRLENSLLQAGKLAAIGQLAAGVAHEINNPLTVINANAEMLKMFIPSEDENYESVDLIARAGERAANVVRHLLNFARQNQYSFARGDVNLSIEQALKLVKYQFDSANIVVDCDLAPALPQIRASWEHLKTVWLNLLINARDAILEKRPVRSPSRVTIKTRLAEEGDRVQVIFEDNGVGISPAQAAHIFEPFYTTKAPGRGTGLGLATSHRIVEQHGGQVELFSRPAGGTAFAVHLPVTGAGEPLLHRDSVNIA